ncbi:site-specific integrase [bacterium LRH843]|nr:site-specific integrase [bacterium LRH843]
MVELLPVFIQQYIHSLLEKGRQKSTIKRYLYDLNDFSNWIQKTRQTTEHLNWKTITAKELEDFFDELVTKREYNIRTIRRIHSVLRQLARYQKSIGSTELQSIEGIAPPELLVGPLSPSEWLSHTEALILMQAVPSENGLSDNQLETFPFYKERNFFIIRLFLYYGLTLQEVHQLSMNDIKFEKNELSVSNRIIKLKEEDKQLAYSYFTTIPEPVRPRYHSEEPFMIAFDFKRKTFHWSYDEDSPKRMTMIAIQKMLRMEIKRAGLRKGISSQTLRHTFILSNLAKGRSHDNLIELIGYTSPLSLKRYENTIAHLTADEASNLRNFYKMFHET